MTMDTLPLTALEPQRPTWVSTLAWALVGVAVVGAAAALGHFQHRDPLGEDGAAAQAANRPVRPVAPAAGGLERDPTSTPVLPVRRAVPTASGLRWPLWESQLKQAIPPRDTPLTPTGWRLIGATQTSGKWQLIILRQDQTAPSAYSTGDKLPNGYVVGRITEEDVTLIDGKRAMVLSYIGVR